MGANADGRLFQLLGRPKMPRPSDLLTIKEVAEVLRLSERKARDLTGSGELPSFKIGGSIRVKQSELDEYLESCRQQPPVPISRPQRQPPVKLQFLK